MTSPFADDVRDSFSPYPMASPIPIVAGVAVIL